MILQMLVFDTEAELDAFLNSLGVPCQVKEPKKESKGATFDNLQALYEKLIKQFNGKQVDPVMEELAKQDADDLKRVFAKPIDPLTGGSVNYYTVKVKGQPVECGDVIDALQLTFNEANIIKEIWRTANARLGNGKPGNTNLRGAEKIAYYANRILAAEQEHVELVVKRGIDKNPLTVKI